MISSLSGSVQSIRTDSLVLQVGPVGLLVQATSRTLTDLRIGQNIQLATTLVVREDSLTIFGFVEDDEREIFESVQKVSGIGPKMALSLLAVHEPEALRRAVATEDIAAMKRVPGVGLKSAQRLILELKGKIGLPGAPSASPGAPSPKTRAPDSREQVLQALIGLGWPAKAAQSAMTTVLAESPADGAEVNVPVVLRAALQELGRS